MKFSKYAIVALVTFFLHACRQRCESPSIENLTEMKAIYGLGKPDTVWLPDINKLINNSDLITTNKFKFTAYGKNQYYSQYDVDCKFVCKSKNWFVMDDHSNYRIIDDKLIIDSLKRINPTYTNASILYP